MSIFSPIKLSWDGKEYVIPPSRVMRTIASIEDVLTLGELQAFYERKTAPMAKLARAYALVLEMAGARVTDEQVYEGMFGEGSQEVVSGAIAGLLAMMLPPKALAPLPQQAASLPKKTGRKRV